MMANRGIYFDADERVKKRFQKKCLDNDTTQKAVLGEFIREYGSSKPKTRKVKIPWITKALNS